MTNEYLVRAELARRAGRLEEAALWVQIHDSLLRSEIVFRRREQNTKS